jgi:hypothetical protein
MSKRGKIAGAGALLAWIIACAPDAEETTTAAQPAVAPVVAPGVAQGGGDDDAAFAALIHQAAAAMESAARGQPHDARWNALNPAHDLRGTGGPLAELAGLGNWSRAATAVELEAKSSAPTGLYVRSNVLVFPDGRVRWWRIEHRESSGAREEPSEFAEAASPLRREALRMIAALRDPACTSLPAATDADLAPLPEALRRDANIATDLRATCDAVRARGDEPFVPLFDDITVIATGQAGWASLRSGFEVQNGRLTLGRVRAMAPR